MKLLQTAYTSSLLRVHFPVQWTDLQTKWPIGLLRHSHSPLCELLSDVDGQVCLLLERRCRFGLTIESNPSYFQLQGLANHEFSINLTWHETADIFVGQPSREEMADLDVNFGSGIQMHIISVKLDVLKAPADLIVVREWNCEFPFWIGQFDPCPNHSIFTSIVRSQEEVLCLSLLACWNRKHQ